MMGVQGASHIDHRFTTIAFVPQAIKTWRSGSAEDISLFMFILSGVGMLLWLIYGIAIGTRPVMLALSIPAMKLRHMWQKWRHLQASAQRGL
jgi:uncharacterized protein with PQ loop repeat